MWTENAEADLCLPAAPHGLCFDRSDFVKSNFSVDTFLAEHSDGTSLETIRDDLGAYLKVLRLAMIELINRDYANFVSLSATLVGFDKAVDKIQRPLLELKDEVLNVKQSLEEAMRELSLWRNKESLLKQKKLTLKYYRDTISSLYSLNKSIKQFDTEPSEASVQVERAAMIYNQLKFTISKCSSLIKNEEQNLYSEIGEKLINTLNDLLFRYYNEKDEDGLLKTFLTLATLNKVSETEMLLRRKAVGQCLHDIIAESTLQKDPNGLQGIYERVLSLLDNELKILLHISQHSKLAILVKKYNFLINSFWVEVESRLEIHLASIFAPGNPKIFYARYSDSMEFLRKLETYCPDDKTVMRLRATPEYKSFHKRWNLPVYFQIRFQEIAGSFESSLSTEAPADSDWRRGEAVACWRALHDSWTDGVYVQALAHKFWKLSLQLLARYGTWVEEVCDNKPKPQDRKEIDTNLIQTCIDCYSDVNRMNFNLPHYLSMVKNKTQLEATILEDSLKISSDALNDKIPKIKNCVIAEMFEFYSTNLKQVSDIPRLYRKTNRSVPKSPCGYIEVLRQSVEEFRRKYEDLDKAFMMDLMTELFARTTESYYTSVEEVLTSVQKTEDSLRRLKQIRDGTPRVETAGISDGDKIRLQLCVDAKAFGEVFYAAEVDRSGKMDELERLVMNAVKDVDIK